MEIGASKERVQGLQEALKAGKLYLKGDFKVIVFLSSTSLFSSITKLGSD